MKKTQTPRSDHDPHAHRDIAIRGRAGAARGTLLEPTGILTGRRFRRANRLTHEQADLLGRIVHGPGGATAHRGLTVGFDEVRRMLIGADPT